MAGVALRRGIDLAHGMGIDEVPLTGSEGNPASRRASHLAAGD
ncbi:hypothetical protein [Corynebacterium pacaense]|nr:hypothetical protein [Corynebacterium pacaense]